MSRVERYIRIALDVPIGGAFDYAWPLESHADSKINPQPNTLGGGSEVDAYGGGHRTLSGAGVDRESEIQAGMPMPNPGDWVLVPWARGRKVGIVLDVDVEPSLDVARIRPAIGLVADGPPADAAWLNLGAFASSYYHRSIGEVLLSSVPRLLREPPTPKARGTAFGRARARWQGALPSSGDPAPGAPPRPTAEQQAVLDSLNRERGFAVHLLHGITGSGKTLIYLHWLSAVLDASPQAQVLLLVPEIALTPQLVARLRDHFANQTIAVLHSDMADGERAAHWLAAAEGHAQLVVGTRMAVLAPLPRLAAIVVDEEHDPSYRQQEGIRYSARDLAVVLASQRAIPVVLGSATPALESWHAAQRGRYRLHQLHGRPGGGALPTLQIVDTRRKSGADPAKARREAASAGAGDHGLGEAALAAIERALGRGEQALVFLNRRGYAPVLSCAACGWVSDCDACSAHRVLHRRTGPRSAADPRAYRLVCHHCGSEAGVPRACPTCGNLDLQPLGQGTQRLEQGLRVRFPNANIARLDRDVARRRGAAEAVLQAVHGGTVDIVIGTQMLAKGHDFERLSAVIVVDADGGLYASDFRAPERLFATLVQVAGRAGRSAVTGQVGEVVVQTHFPDHPLFAALSRHDYPAFAAQQLEEREQVGLPPYLFQAMLRAEARSVDAALAWLAHARAMAGELVGDDQRIAIYDPIPLPMVRVANTERAQLLVESASRKALHQLIERWLESLRTSDPANDAISRGVRWFLEVDPIEI